MTARVTYTRDLLIALFVAVWAHIILFLVFVVLLFFDLIAGKILVAVDEEASKKSEVTELNIIFEDEGFVSEVAAPDEMIVPQNLEGPNFIETESDPTMTKPAEAEFIGANDSVATSDVDAEAGDQKDVALSGQDEQKNDIATFDSNFTEGENRGAQIAGLKEGGVGDGPDEMSQDEVQPAPESKALTEANKPEDHMDEFESIDGVERKIEDDFKKFLEMAEANNPDNEEPQVVKKQGGGSVGGFQTQQSKTRIRGSLNASGKGSLDVENTALGRYEAKIFKQIEREWQARNFQFRSYLAPGFITLRFILDEKGMVSGQRRTDMRGTSGIQWGLVLQAVEAAQIPAMPNEVVKELNGEELELTVTFNY